MAKAVNVTVHRSSNVATVTKVVVPKVTVEKFCNWQLRKVVKWQITEAVKVTDGSRTHSDTLQDL